MEVLFSNQMTVPGFQCKGQVQTSFSNSSLGQVLPIWDFRLPIRCLGVAGASLQCGGQVQNP